MQSRAGMGVQQSCWALGSFQSAMLGACLSSTTSEMAARVLVAMSASRQVDEAGHRARRGVYQLSQFLLQSFPGIPIQ